MKLSVVDLSQVPVEGNQADALHNSIQLACHLDKLGYHRYWIAEHHGLQSFASHSPEVMIPLIANATKNIRVGSGGILLNHYSPFKIAEQFRILHALFPGRIDLGFGSSFTGKDQVLFRDRNLERVDDYEQQVKELISWITVKAPDNFPDTKKFIFSDVKGCPMPWVLASGEKSAILAGKLGLRFAFASFIDSEKTQAAMLAYRNAFQPFLSEAGIQKPYSILAVNVVCAETVEEAERLAMTVRYMKGADTWHDKRLATPEQSIQHFGHVIRIHEEEWPKFIIGDPKRVKFILERMAKAAQADEIMIQDIICDHKDRLRSYELIAKEFGLIANAASS